MTPAKAAVMEGAKVLVVERRPPLQPSLDRLLAAITPAWTREDIRPTGASVRCERDRDHRFGILREGRHVGLDGQVRDLRVEMCRDCGAALVRDVSYDRLPGLRSGRKGLARKNEVLGWYSGRRRRGREYK